MIVNIEQATQTSFNGFRVLEGRYPKYIHYCRANAEKELLRLQSTYPNGEFVLLESVATAVKKMVFTVEPIEEIPF